MYAGPIYQINVQRRNLITPYISDHNYIKVHNVAYISVHYKNK